MKRNVSLFGKTAVCVPDESNLDEKESQEVERRCRGGGGGGGGGCRDISLGGSAKMNADFPASGCGASDDVDDHSPERAKRLPLELMASVVEREARGAAAVATTTTTTSTVAATTTVEPDVTLNKEASVNQLNEPLEAALSGTRASSCGYSTCSANSKVCNAVAYNHNYQGILATPQADSNQNCNHQLRKQQQQQQDQLQQLHQHAPLVAHQTSPNCFKSTASVSTTATTADSNLKHQHYQQQQQHNNNNINNQDSSSNSFLFWKLLSNLPKSITQRSKSITSSTLTPEVEGYLAKKRQCEQRREKGELPEIISSDITMTATKYDNEDDADDDELVVGQRAMAMKSIGSKRRRQLPAAKSGRDQEQQVVLVEEQGQSSLIRIIAPPAAAPVAASSDSFASPTDDQQAATNRPISEHNDKHHVKLSLTTTTTTTTTNTTHSSASSLGSCILSESSTSEVRLKWGKKMDFLLSIIGFAVDLANIWRFPYLVYKNGGGVFLIPYITMLIFGGIPLFFLELCLGQFVKKGPITVWNKICPSMKGVGYCSLLISWYVSFYYNVLIAWSVYFIYRSLTSFGEKMPWEDCDNSWNSNGTCVSISALKSMCSTRNESLEACRKEMFNVVNVTSPASEFFVKELSQIDQSTGLDDMGYLRPELVLCAVIVYLLHYFSLFRGLETSGKVVWVTATAPYMILSILLVRGLFLPGAWMGIEYYLSPKLEKLAESGVWIDAAGQVFYSIGVGFGVHLTYASFNSHNNNCYRDCIMTSAVNAATSVYSGLVVFVYLGYMAKNLGIEIDKVANEGYSLVFEVYPEALTTLPFARFWSILFFIMLLTLGIDSAVSNLLVKNLIYHIYNVLIKQTIQQMGGLEAVITGLEDEFRFAKRLSRSQLTGLVIVSSFLPALISCTQGGAYTLFWFDIYSAGVSLLFSALFETIGVVYCYGLKKFLVDIESMLGRRPHIFYILCWKYISPILLGGVIFMSIYTASATVPTYRGYTFPLWSIILGWCLAFSSVSAIPIVAVWHWYTHRGKELTDKSVRKRSRCSSSVASSRHSSSKKSPNHKSVLVSCTGQGGLTTTTTTTLYSS